MESLHRQFSKITAAIFQHYGFAHADLITRWAEIAGADIAKVTQPERIKWPRKRAETSRGQRLAGTLVLRTSLGHALTIQHKIPLILERINSFYGYQAITHVVLKQGDWLKKTEPQAVALPELSDKEQQALDGQLAGIKEAPLKAALSRLGTIAKARKLQRKAADPR